LVRGDHVDVEGLEVPPERMNRIGEPPVGECLGAQNEAELVGDGSVGDWKPGEEEEPGKQRQRRGEGDGERAAIGEPGEPALDAASGPVEKQKITNNQT